MQNLNLPNYDFKLKTIEGKKYIFDQVRKKYLILTPEEWVRQHFINFLRIEFNYPLSLMTVEQPLKYNSMNKRSDIICYNELGEMVLMVECKAPSVKLNQSVFDQIARYNVELKLPFLVVTNGLSHYCCALDYHNQSYEFVENIPNYQPC